VKREGGRVREGDWTAHFLGRFKPEPDGCFDLSESRIAGFSPCGTSFKFMDDGDKTLVLLAPEDFQRRVVFQDRLPNFSIILISCLAWYAGILPLRF